MNVVTMEWALETLQPNFNDDGGWLSLKNPNYLLTDLDWEAINYLEDEWDYAWVGRN